MELIEIIVIILALGLVSFTVIYNVRKRKKGSCNCSPCGECSVKSNCKDFRDK